TISNSQLVLTGKVNHNYPYNTAINGPRAIFFISGEGNTVSGDNYEQSFSRILNYADGASFGISTPIDYNLFPPGTTLTIIGYGVASYDAGYLDIESNTTIYPTLSSQPSNVTSIKIP
ncbi:MAG TPA: hypothetical protein VFW11_19470, partial [Cyclobacteriaceae bacterium]|nr:hypothetical protein [Cyclobacteriaceae bacterium]